MKQFKEKLIVGIDHGYGNIKTANHCFKTGIMGYDAEPLFTKDMLVYGGRYYLIGEGHKEFLPDKIKDEDYYLLTLVAIAVELKDKGLTEADIIIAAGLPLTWTSGQKNEFAAYLSKNEEASFTYQHTAYHIRICGVRIYPQGYAAVAEFVTTMKGLSVVADIGNGTMNTLFLTNGRPMSSKMYTEKFGTYQCTLAIREEFMQKTRREINDVIIDEVLQNGTADIPAADLKIIKATATEYVKDIFRRLREHGYDEGTMTLYITGGGGCLVKNFYLVQVVPAIFHPRTQQLRFLCVPEYLLFQWWLLFRNYHRLAIHPDYLRISRRQFCQSPLSESGILLLGVSRAPACPESSPFPLRFPVSVPDSNRYPRLVLAQRYPFQQANNQTIPHLRQNSVRRRAMKNRYVP